MKSYKQVSDIFDYIRLTHKQMSDFYNRLHTKEESERMKILLNYLTKYEKHREETLAQYENETVRKIMNTWYKYIPDDTTAKCLESFEIKPGMTVDDVIDMYLKLNNCLIELYDNIVKETESKQVEEMFTSLIKKLEKDEKNLVRDTEWLYDA